MGGLDLEPHGDPRCQSIIGTLFHSNVFLRPVFGNIFTSGCVCYLATCTGYSMHKDKFLLASWHEFKICLWTQLCGKRFETGLLPFCLNNPYGFRVNQMEGILFRIWQVSTPQFFAKSWYACAKKVDIYETFVQQNVILTIKQMDYGLGLVFLYCAKFPNRMNCREIISGKTDWLFLVSFISCQCLPLKDPHMQIVVFLYLDFSLSP